MTVDTSGIGAALNTNLQVGTAIRTTQHLDSIAQDNDARQKAEIARLKAGAGHSSSSASSDAEYQAMQLRGALDKARQEVAAKDALILEWMHSNEAFKLLARRYGKKLGMTDDQRQEDFKNQVGDLAETAPEYSNTKMAAWAKSPT